jgi:hypothetical protein
MTSLPSSFLHETNFDFWGYSKISELSHSFKIFIIYFDVVISSWILISNHGHITKIFSAFTYRPISLLGSTKASVFFFLVCTLPPNELAQTSSWCVPFYIKPSWFASVILLAYSKAKMKSNGDIASRLKQFLNGKVSDKCLPTRTLLQVSFRHIFVTSNARLTETSTGTYNAYLFFFRTFL